MSCTSRKGVKRNADNFYPRPSSAILAHPGNILGRRQTEIFKSSSADEQGCIQGCHPGPSADFLEEGLGWSRMARGWPRMVLRIILGFFPGCDVSSFQDGRGWSRGWPRMVFRIILGIFLDAAWVNFRMLQDGSRMAQDSLKDHPGILCWMWHE